MSVCVKIYTESNCCFGLRQYQYDRKYHRRGFQGDPDKSTCLMALVSDHRFHQSNGQGEVGATAQMYDLCTVLG